VNKIENQGPKKTFRAGSVRATIWDNEVELPAIGKTNMPKVLIERRYKNSKGEWASSHNFNVNELAKLQAVIGKAYDYLLFGTQDDDEEKSESNEKSEINLEQ